MIQKFIVIDDNQVNNLLCTYIIEDTYPKSVVKTFLEAEEALCFIKTEYAASEGIEADTILFLDINMPIMDGWQFLEAYDLLDENVKNSIEIYMLSSSIDQRDIDHAANNKYALSFFGKPLTDEIVTGLVKKEDYEIGN